MEYDPAHALRLLRLGTGQADAAFRDAQEEAVRHVVEGKGRLLLVQKTGWGKSNVYFIATKILREAGLGPTLLVSPLLSLMRNQILQAQRHGVRAERITSDNTDDWDEIEGRIRSNEVDLLLISPERLANERFSTGILAEIAGTISLLVIDEAHCISDWGHDFRPEYRLIARTVRDLPTKGWSPEVRNTVELIDVIWLKPGTGDIVSAFEVEKSTSIYSGILRLEDLARSVPDLSCDLYIVAPDDRKKQVMAQFSRPAFSDLSDISLAYISFGDLCDHCDGLCMFGEDHTALSKIASKKLLA